MCVCGGEDIHIRVSMREKHNVPVSVCACVCFDICVHVC